MNTEEMIDALLERAYMEGKETIGIDVCIMREVLADLRAEREEARAELVQANDEIENLKVLCEEQEHSLRRIREAL